MVSVLLANFPILIYPAIRFGEKVGRPDALTAVWSLLDLGL